MNTKKFAGIDYFRFIAAFMVIAIHISPFAIWNKDVDYLLTYCLGRIAVPFFLMTTGYFVLAPFVKTNFQKKHSIHKYITKNTILYLSATLFYMPLAIYSGNLPHSMGEFLKQLFFDGTFYHLWYFPAAIIGCILLVFLIKKSIGTAVIFSVIAYVIGLFGDSYYGIVKDVPLLGSLYDGIFHISSYTRNGIFFAPIFILLGVLLANPQFHCSKYLCKWGFIISLLLMFLEGFLTYSLGLQKHNSMYFLLIPTMYFLFQLLLYFPLLFTHKLDTCCQAMCQEYKTAEKPAFRRRRIQNRLDSVTVCTVGVNSNYFPQQQVPVWLRNGSMLLYIIHPAVIVVVRGIAKITKSTKLLIDNTFIQYLTVCVLSLIIVFSIQFFLGRRRGTCIKKEDHGLN